MLISYGALASPVSLQHEGTQTARVLGGFRSANMLGQPGAHGILQSWHLMRCAMSRFEVKAIRMAALHKHHGAMIGARLFGLSEHRMMGILQAHSAGSPYFISDVATTDYLDAQIYMLAMGNPALCT